MDYQPQYCFATHPRTSLPTAQAALKRRVSPLPCRYCDSHLGLDCVFASCTRMPHLHHDIAHPFIHAYLFIYTCRFSFRHSCCQPHAHIRTHKFQCRPSQYNYSETTHSCTAPPYLAAWMSGPLRLHLYLSFVFSDVCAFSYTV